jgi:hypothetical protein
LDLLMDIFKGKGNVEDKKEASKKEEKEQRERQSFSKGAEKKGIDNDEEELVKEAEEEEELTPEDEEQIRQFSSLLNDPGHPQLDTEFVPLLGNETLKQIEKKFNKRQKKRDHEFRMKVFPIVEPNEPIEYTLELEAEDPKHVHPMLGKDIKLHVEKTADGKEVGMFIERGLI